MVFIDVGEVGWIIWNLGYDFSLYCFFDEGLIGVVIKCVEKYDYVNVDRRKLE